MDLTLAERLRIIETDLAQVAIRFRVGGLQGRALDAARALILAVADEMDRVKP